MPKSRTKAPPRPSRECMAVAEWLARSHGEVVWVVAPRKGAKGEPQPLRESIASLCGIEDLDYPAGRVLRRVKPGGGSSL